MPNKLESAKISDIIQSATQEIVSQTEAFIKSVAGKPLGTETISVMINGDKIILNQDDYKLLKAQNDVVKAKMKEDIKALTDKYKASLKAEPNE